MGRFLRVAGGREYVARVPGVAQAPLDDAAVAALLNWMLPHFDKDGMPSDAAPYTAEEIAGLRLKPLVDVEGTRRQLLDALARSDGKASP